MNDEDLVLPADDEDEKWAAIIIATLKRRGWAPEESCWWFPPAFNGAPLCMAYQDEDDSVTVSRLGPVQPLVDFGGGRVAVYDAGSFEPFACPEHVVHHTVFVYAHYTDTGLLAQLEDHLGRVESRSTDLDPDAYLRCFLDGPCRRRFDQEFTPPPLLAAGRASAQDPAPKESTAETADAPPTAQTNTADPADTADDEAPDEDTRADAFEHQGLVGEYRAALRRTYGTLREHIQESTKSLENAAADARRIAEFNAGHKGELSATDQDYLGRDVTHAMHALRNLYRITEFHLNRVADDAYQHLVDFSSIPAVDQKRRRLLDNIRDWHSTQDPA